jgi:hypothetical protein
MSCVELQVMWMCHAIQWFCKLSTWVWRYENSSKLSLAAYWMHTLSSSRISTIYLFTKHRKTPQSTAFRCNGKEAVVHCSGWKSIAYNLTFCICLLLNQHNSILQLKCGSSIDTMFPHRGTTLFRNECIVQVVENTISPNPIQCIFITVTQWVYAMNGVCFHVHNLHRSKE